MPNRGRKVEHLVGKAVAKVVKRGTASEHLAVVLQTAAGDEVILQRIGGNAFDDAMTKALAGHDVRVEGFRLNDIFRFRKAVREADE